MVWANPRSLATTCGITIVFSSSGYLDVSVPRVTVFRHHAFSMIGFPIRTSTDQSLFAAPRSFSQLITSFVVSESQGIPHTLLFASYSSTVKGYLFCALMINYFCSLIYYYYYSSYVNELLGTSNIFTYQTKSADPVFIACVGSGKD